MLVDPMSFDLFLVLLNFNSVSKDWSVVSGRYRNCPLSLSLKVNRVQTCLECRKIHHVRMFKGDLSL